MIVVWALTWVLMPSAVYSIDELIQLSSLGSTYRFPAFPVENGFETFGNEALLLHLLIPGPNGPVQQYPSGFVYLSYPLFLLGGVKGVSLLNFIAGLGTLFVSFKIFEKIGDRTVAYTGLLILAACTFLGISLSASNHLRSDCAFWKAVAFCSSVKSGSGMAPRPDRKSRSKLGYFRGASPTKP